MLSSMKLTVLFRAVEKLEPEELKTLLIISTILNYTTERVEVEMLKALGLMVVPIPADSICATEEWMTKARNLSKKFNEMLEAEEQLLTECN